MLKKTLNLNNVKTLTKTEQKEIKGGFWGGGFGCNQPVFAQCFSDNDCPCNRRCGVNVEVTQGEFIFFNDLCEFS